MVYERNIAPNVPGRWRTFFEDAGQWVSDAAPFARSPKMRPDRFALYGLMLTGVDRTRRITALCTTSGVIGVRRDAS